MACPKKNGNGNKKRKRLPSINPFFHYLKCVWKKFKGCKKSAVLRYAVTKWKCMSRCEKQPFYDAACKAQKLHRQAKKCPKPKPKCPKPKPKCPKPKPKCPKKKPKCPKPKPKCPKKKKKKMCCPPCPEPEPCPPCPPCPPCNDQKSKC